MGNTLTKSKIELYFTCCGNMNQCSKMSHSETQWNFIHIHSNILKSQEWFGHMFWNWESWLKLAQGCDWMYDNNVDRHISIKLHDHSARWPRNWDSWSSVYFLIRDISTFEIVSDRSVKSHIYFGVMSPLLHNDTCIIRTWHVTRESCFKNTEKSNRLTKRRFWVGTSHPRHSWHEWQCQYVTVM